MPSLNPSRFLLYAISAVLLITHSGWGMAQAANPIQNNLQSIQALLPEKVTLVAVSKTKPVSDLMEAYEAGQRIFGENKIQEMTEKWEAMPKDIQWHFIGHLQTNKIKYIVPFVELIHGVDSYKLLAEINKQAAKANRVVNCLLQIHIAQEETKFGFSAQELLDTLQAGDWKNLQHVKICGLMGMATYTDNTMQVKAEFSQLKALFDQVKTTCFAEEPAFKNISMGMSDDFQLAIEQGSTMVRVGSLIFGNRNY